MNKIDALTKHLALAQERIRAAEQARKIALDDERTILGQLRVAQSDQLVGNVSLTCMTCDADVHTEELFSLHYTIDDWRYVNLGHCPTRDVAPTS